MRDYPNADQRILPGAVEAGFTVGFVLALLQVLGKEALLSYTCEWGIAVWSAMSKPLAFSPQVEALQV